MCDHQLVNDAQDCVTSWKVLFCTIFDLFAMLSE